MYAHKIFQLPMQAVSPCIAPFDYTPSGAIGFFRAAPRARFSCGSLLAD